MSFPFADSHNMYDGQIFMYCEFFVLFAIWVTTDFTNPLGFYEVTLAHSDYDTTLCCSIAILLFCACHDHVNFYMISDSWVLHKLLLQKIEWVGIRMKQDYSDIFLATKKLSATMWVFITLHVLALYMALWQCSYNMRWWILCKICTLIISDCNGEKWLQETQLSVTKRAMHLCNMQWHGLPPP